MARRRAAWPLRKGWRRTDKGNLSIAAHGYRITVFRRSSGFGAVLSKIDVGFKRFSRRTYDSETAAQLATHDALTAVRSRETAPS